jgi:hypothetical protein
MLIPKRSAVVRKAAHPAAGRQLVGVSVLGAGPPVVPPVVPIGVGAPGASAFGAAVPDSPGSEGVFAPGVPAGMIGWPGGIGATGLTGCFCISS